MTLAGKVLKNADICDMNCAYKCVDDQENVGNIVECVQEICECPFVEDAFEKY